MIQNEVNQDDDDGRQFSMDLSTHSRFAMAFDLKPPDRHTGAHSLTHTLLQHTALNSVQYMTYVCLSVVPSNRIMKWLLGISEPKLLSMIEN